MVVRGQTVGVKEERFWHDDFKVHRQGLNDVIAYCILKVNRSF
jgi:hypothetical protein